MFNQSSTKNSNDPRTGSMIPALGIAILVMGAGMALVLNQVWLTNTQTELRHTAEASALAAAQALADDELLRTHADSRLITDQALSAGLDLASETPVKGRAPVVEIQFGRIAVSETTGHREVLHTDYFPNVVIAEAFRDEAHGNPAGMLMPAFTGLFATDVHAMAEASVSSAVRAVRPIGGANLSIWPLAIREEKLDGVPVEAWVPHIEQHQGTDQFSWDSESHEVYSGSDGLPEITLVTKSGELPGNLVQVFVGEAAEHQFENGWSSADLEQFDGEFPTGPTELDLDSSRTLEFAVTDHLEQQIGQTRMILLYSGDAGESDSGSVTFTRLVAARLMQIRHNAGEVELVMQPAVITTRMAVLDEAAIYDADETHTKYIYKLALTQ